MTKGYITKSMLDNLSYDNNADKEMSTTKDAKATQADAKRAVTALVVFAGGDVNAAAYHLCKQLEQSLVENAVASIFVQESIREDFVGIVKSNLKPVSLEIGENAGYKKALETVKQLNLKTINSSVVFDATHEQLTPDGVAPGWVTLHTFRTVKEAIALIGKESIAFETLSIWHQNHSSAYELVNNLRSKHFFVNCFQVPLEPVKVHIKKNANFVTMDKSYHFETMQLNGIQKTIVFPVGTIFAN